MRRVWLAAALALVATPASAMTVADFLAKAERLQKKGVLALMSSDVGLLKREGMGAAQALRAERLAAVKAGRSPGYCPPAKGGMSSDELLAGFRALPPAQRQQSVKAGMATVLRKKWPCPA